MPRQLLKGNLLFGPAVVLKKLKFISTPCIAFFLISITALYYLAHLQSLQWSCSVPAKGCGMFISALTSEPAQNRYQLRPVLETFLPAKKFPLKNGHLMKKGAGILHIQAISRGEKQDDFPRENKKKHRHSPASEKNTSSKEKIPLAWNQISRDNEGIPDLPLDIPPRVLPDVDSLETASFTGLKSLVNFNNLKKGEIFKRKNMYLSVAGGSCKGRKLASVPIDMRPMMGKVKEAVFSTLRSIEGLANLKDARVLDLYSGTGSVGIEALSRGFQHVTFVDISRACCEVIGYNLGRCKMFEKARILRAAAEEVLASPGRFSIAGHYSVIFVCPPYEKVVYSKLINTLSQSPLIAEDTIIVIEYPKEIGTLPQKLADGHLIGFRNRRYGRTVVAYYAVKPTERLKNLKFREDEFVPVHYSRKQLEIEGYLPRNTVTSSYAIKPA